MTEELTLHEKLIDIQQNLKVPKDQANEFGGFKYRNLEDIEDRVKPFLKKHNLILKFEDEPVAIGDRIYIKATATLSDGKDAIIGTAYAREAVNPKAKTDDAQLTGACSSYARKYAASGLFLIDNTKDADSTSGALNTFKAQKPQRDIQLDQMRHDILDQLHAHNITEADDMKNFIFGTIGQEKIDNLIQGKQVLKALEKLTDKEIQEEDSVAP